MTTLESVIKEIRASRKRISAECGHEPSRLIEYLKAFNRKYASQVDRYRSSHGAQTSADEPGS